MRTSAVVKVKQPHVQWPLSGFRSDSLSASIMNKKMVSTTANNFYSK